MPCCRQKILWHIVKLKFFCSYQGIAEISVVSKRVSRRHNVGWLVTFLIYYDNGIMDDTGYATELLSKKIFFLYPSVVVQNHVIAELIQQEYEIYTAKDHFALKRVLKRYPHSIVFADIGEQMPEYEWETWIQNAMNSPETRGTAVGIISANDDEILQRKYLNMVKIQCGYTVIGSDLNSSILRICDILKTAEAKGRRKYIRATTEAETICSINIPLNGTYINGTIKDISVVGLSCVFDTDPKLEKNTLFRDIQIKLQSIILKVEGIVFGTRMDGRSKIYVLLFTQRIDSEARAKIRKYMQQNLQSKMDAELISRN